MAASKLSQQGACTVYSTDPYCMLRGQAIDFLFLVWFCKVRTQRSERNYPGQNLSTFFVEVSLYPLHPLLQWWVALENVFLFDLVSFLFGFTFHHWMRGWRGCECGYQVSSRVEGTHSFLTFCCACTSWRPDVGALCCALKHECFYLRTCALEIEYILRRHVCALIHYDSSLTVHSQFTHISLYNSLTFHSGKN